jgi:hypothetical protein
MRGGVIRNALLWLVALTMAFAFVGPLGLIIGVVLAGYFLLAKAPAPSPHAASFGEVRRAPPRVELQTPPRLCALCLRAEPLLFETPRLLVCEACVWAVRDAGGGDIGGMQRELECKLESAAESENPGEQHPPMDVLVRVALEDRWGREVLDAHMEASGYYDWRECLRAYHLGLVAFPDRARRPDDETWRVLAHQIRVEDGMHCLVCRTTLAALHVHHIIPLSEGGTNDRRNLVTLCHDCHLGEHPGGSFSRPDPLAAT